MKKYEFTGDTIEFLGLTLYQIRALVDFANIEAGEVGGFIQSERNLSQDGNAWVYGNAMVYGNAWVYGNARVYDNAEVYGNAMVYDNARVCGNANVCENADVCGNAEVCGDALIYQKADYSCVNGFGSVGRDTTFFKTKGDGVMVVCGCFTGTLDEFREKVKETHKDSKFAKEYLMLADLMEFKFKT